MTTFAVPDAQATLPADINHQGQVVGAYFDQELQQIYGFLREPDDTVTTIHVEGSGYLTAAQGINDDGRTTARSSA